MIVGDYVVHTPAEDGLLAKPYWRHELAKAYAESDHKGRYPSVVDEYVRNHIRYLRCMGDAPLTGELAHHQNASRWDADDEVPDMLIPYLVSGMPVQEIARELGVDANALDVYEKMYFDVLDEQRCLRPGAVHHVVQERVFPLNRDAILTRAALYGGPTLLRRMRGIPERGDGSDDQLLNRIVETEQIRRVLAGDMPNADLARIANINVARERMRFETGQSSSKVMEGYQFALDLLKKMVPEVVAQGVKSEEEKGAADEAIRSKLRAQDAINKEQVAASGSGEDSINEHLKARFRNAGAPV